MLHAPPDEITPKDDAVKDGEARKVKPRTCRRIGHAGADSEFLGVQGLIQATFLQHGFQRDSFQLLVVSSRGMRVITWGFHDLPRGALATCGILCNIVAIRRI